MIAQTQTTVDIQNDIADFLKALIELLGLDTDSGLGEFLHKMAEFFERLTQTGVQSIECQRTAQFLQSECFNDLLVNIREDVRTALIGVLQQLPEHVSEAVQCSLGGDTAQPQLFGIDKCLIAAATEYFRSRDILKTITAYFSCKAADGGGGNGSLALNPNTQARC